MNSVHPPSKLEGEITEKFLREQIRALAELPSLLERTVKTSQLVHKLCTGSGPSSESHVLNILLEELPSLCFKLGINNSAIICDILLCIDSVNGALCKFCCSLMENALSDNSVQQDTNGNAAAPLPYITYFLKHAAAGRFLIRGKKLPALLFEFSERAACQNDFILCHDAQYILTILQHGSGFLDAIGESLDCHEIFAEFLATLIVLGWELNQWEFPSMDIKMKTPNLPLEILGLADKLRIMLRTVVNPHVATLKVTQLLFDIPCFRETNYPESAILQWYDMLFPGMYFGHPRAPSLKRLCRYAIRKRLDENWVLPDGVRKLGLPHVLENYVNIEED